MSYATDALAVEMKLLGRKVMRAGSAGDFSFAMTITDAGALIAAIQQVLIETNNQK